VQGVGFRFTAVHIARQFPGISGFVRNLPDGRVELVAEGSSGDLDEFIAQLNSEMSRYIRDVESRHEPPIGKFAGFRILH
jgi:acylphosphatase